MRKIIEVIDKKKQIIKVTVADERWYIKKKGSKQEFYPSVTWIASYYPKGIAFYKWLASKGWDEALAIRQAAADKGSKVHQAIAALLDGKIVHMHDKFYIEDEYGSLALQELTLEEYEALMAFCDWYKNTKPAPIKWEFVLFNENPRFAGTADLLAEINRELYIIDFKTSQTIWPEHKLQVSAYAYMASLELGEVKRAILQVGYHRNERGWKFTEIEDKYPLFYAVYSIWKDENEGAQPSVKDYPLSLCLEDRNEKKKN